MPDANQFFVRHFYDFKVTNFFKFSALVLIRQQEGECAAQVSQRPHDGHYVNVFLKGLPCLGQRGPLPADATAATTRRNQVVEVLVDVAAAGPLEERGLPPRLSSLVQLGDQVVAEAVVVDD